MIKKLFNITILTLSIIAITIASFSYTLFAENDIKYNYEENSISNSFTNNNHINFNNIYNNKNIKKTVSTVDTQYFNIYNTKYVQELSGDIAKLYNDSSFNNNNYTGSDYSSTSIDTDAPYYYAINSFNPVNFVSEDVVFTEPLISFACEFAVDKTYQQFVDKLSATTILTGFADVDFLLEGSYLTYNSMRAIRYTRLWTTDFYFKVSPNATSKHLYITCFGKMKSVQDTVINSNNLNSSNYQNEILFDRFEIPIFSINSQWSYADFFIQSNCLSIYEKSNNIQLKSIDDANGIFYLRIYNNGETGFITLCNVVPVTNVYNTSPTYSSKLFTFYYDTNFNPNDYGSYLNILIQNTDNLENYLNTLNTIQNNQLNTINNIYSSLGTVNINLEDLADANFYIYDTLLEIKNLISDLQVIEIDNIYNDIVNNYNIDIDTEINDLIGNLSIDINSVDFEDSKFNISNDGIGKLGVFKTITNSIISVYDNNNISLLYFVPLVLVIVGAIVL